MDVIHWGLACALTAATAVSAGSRRSGAGQRRELIATEPQEAQRTRFLQHHTASLSVCLKAVVAGIHDLRSHVLWCALRLNCHLSVF